MDGQFASTIPDAASDSARTESQQGDGTFQGPYVGAQRGREEATQVALETLAEGGPLAKVLDLLCRTMENESHDRVIACIHPLNEGATIFCDTAAPSLDRSYRQATDGMLVSSMIGPCCEAVTTRQTVVVPEVAADAKWVKFLEFAAPLGIRSAWSTPIFSNEGKVLGTFAHYYCETRDPSPRDERIVDLLTRAAAVAIQRSRAETALRELNETLEQRVEAETRERLRLWNEHEREAGLILNTIPGLAAILTPAGEVEAVNDELIQYCGQPLEAMKQWATNGTIHAEDLPRIVAPFQEAIGSGQPYCFEMRVRRVGGGYHWCQTRGLPLRDSHGRILRWYVLLYDIDDRKRAEEVIEKVRSELAHVTRATTLSALTASIAHEVNQPLSGIITNADTCLRMLNATPPDIDGARETARRTIRDGNRASDVIARLRALFTNRESAVESLDLNEAVREVVALSSRDLQRSRVSLQLDLTDHLAVVKGDRIQLQQVIVNLLRNACDAMADVHDRRRELQIRTEPEDGGHVRVTMRDAGTGLPPTSPVALFDAFYTTKSGGMGIGLFVSRSIIERHHGRLWAEPNVGTPGATFAFSIPSGGPVVA
jgi:PAS domain S-box-containing protein